VFSSAENTCVQCSKSIRHFLYAHDYEMIDDSFVSREVGSENEFSFLGNACATGERSIVAIGRFGRCARRRIRIASRDNRESRRRVAYVTYMTKVIENLAISCATVYEVICILSFVDRITSFARKDTTNQRISSALCACARD